MPETVGRPFCMILNMLRYGVYTLGLAGKLSPTALQLLAQGQRVDTLLQMGMHADAASLNANVFSYWESDFSARPDSGVFNYLKETGKLNPKMKLEQHLSQIEHWPQSRVHGSFYMLLERTDGTVIISADRTKVYLTQGILSSLGNLLLRSGQHFPCPVIATFLPFHGYVAFDGLVAGAPPITSGNERKKLYRAYCKAVDEGTLITSLPLVPTPPRTAIPVEVPELNAAQTRMLQRLKALSKPSDPEKSLSWVFRRFGYTELENPDHLITIIGSQGMPVMPGFIAIDGLHPTALELFDLLCQALFGDGSETGEHVTAQLPIAAVAANPLSRHCRKHSVLSGCDHDRRAHHLGSVARAAATRRHPGALLPAAHP
jgi:hypothetical protein